MVSQFVKIPKLHLANSGLIIQWTFQPVSLQGFLGDFISEFNELHGNGVKWESIRKKN